MKNVSTEDIVKVVQNYKSYISSICHRFYIVGGTNEDLVEEGVIGLLEACKNYNGESLFEERFDAFAKLCIKRQIIDAIKKANTQKNKALNESISFVNFDENGDEHTKLDLLLDRNISNDPLELFIDKEKVNERLSVCEEVLSDFEKQVLSRFVKGESYVTIAEKLDTPVKSIDNAIQRIRKKAIRNIIDGEDNI